MDIIKQKKEGIFNTHLDVDGLNKFNDCPFFLSPGTRIF